MELVPRGASRLNVQNIILDLIKGRLFFKNIISMLNFYEGILLLESNVTAP